MPEITINLPDPAEGYEWEVKSQGVSFGSGRERFAQFKQVEKHKEPELLYYMDSSCGMWKPNSRWRPDVAVRKLKGGGMTYNGVRYDRILVNHKPYENICLGHWNDGPKEPSE